MRVNVYAEEMTDRVEVVSKTTEDGEFTGVRFWLELPVTAADGAQVKGPFVHRPGDDDSSAVTFWGKKGLRAVLQKALDALDALDARRGDGHAAQDGLAQRVLQAAMATRTHGRDYRNGAQATMLWELVDRAIKGAA